MTRHTLPCDAQTVHWGYFDAALAPVLTIASGDTVTVDTISGAEEDLPPPNGPFTVLPEHHRIHAEVSRGAGPHILTGPIAVDGAMPGDVLRVDILDVRLRQDWGFNRTRPELGALPEDFPATHRMTIGIDPEKKIGRMPWGLDLPLAPFFGCMGVAPTPESGRQTSVIPNYFGGNIDNRDLVAGTTLFLPVSVPGALFSVGDGHAAQGHGEVNLTAIETALTGTFRLSIKKGMHLERPRAETGTHVVTMAFDPDLDEAMKLALRDMIALIVESTMLSRDEAYALCSVAADLIITQVVNRSRGVHATMPHWMLHNLQT